MRTLYIDTYMNEMAIARASVEEAGEILRLQKTKYYRNSLVRSF